MKKFTKTLLVSLIALMIFGIGSVVSVSADEIYNEEENALDALGFDTDKMPAGYDADSADNPYGSDVTVTKTMSELHNLFFADGEDSRTFNSSLLGNNLKLDGKFSTFSNAQNQNKKLLPGVSDYNGRKLFSSAIAGSFDGSGKKTGVAMVYRYEGGELSLRIYDPKKGFAADQIITIAGVPFRSEGRNFIRQAELQVETGDFDNDSMDEIAVYVPGTKDGSRPPKVRVYDKEKTDTDPYKAASWQVSWTYSLPNNTLYRTENEQNMWNNIDLTAGDVDNDGDDDLFISYGYFSYDPDEKSLIDVTHELSGANDSMTVPSKTVLLYGDKKGKVLQESENVNLGDDKLIRVSFAFGDIDGDGKDEMIMGGQKYADRNKNVSRVLANYSYDHNSKKMIPGKVQNMMIVEGTVNGDDFYSTNGLDRRYNSQPLLKTNLAAGALGYSGSSACVYMDGALYSYNGSFTLEGTLEDASEKNDKFRINGGSENAENVIFTGEFGKRDSKEKLDYYGYFEYDVSADNYTGGTTDGLLIKSEGLENVGMIYWDDGYALWPWWMPFPTIEIEGTSRLECAVIQSDTKGMACAYTYEKEAADFKNADEYSALDTDEATPSQPVAVDTDVDSSTLEYTGNHFIEYSKPQVYAVLASPPYFKDVADYDDGEFTAFSETSYGTSKGSGEEKTTSMSVQAGVFLNNTIGSAVVNVSDGLSFSWDYAESKEKEFSISYSTEGGEDCVVFYSIPTENYEYNVVGVTTDKEGNVIKAKNKEIVSIPHQPAVQTMTLDEYNDIQKRYKELPDISGEVLTSTPGDPSSYPSYTGSLKDAVAYDGDWVGTGYGGSTISQEVSYSKSDTKAKSFGGFIDLEFGYSGGIKDVWEVEAGGSVSFEIEKGTGETTSKGSSFGGALHNMPLSAKDYGYYFAWKSMAYKATAPSGYEFPVVSYLVTDVTSPPALPQDFEQDYAETTEDKIALSWTYDDAKAESFDIYRYYEFPQGGGNYKVGTVDGDDFEIRKDEDGNTVLDENGRPIKDFSFESKNLAEDTQYTYRIRVNRAKAPTTSIYSTPLDARTKSTYKPEMSLSTNKLTIYPDGVQKVKLDVAGLDGYIDKAAVYQWQKRVGDEWQDVEGADKSTMTFAGSKKENEGVYRCRVNLIKKDAYGISHYISAYSDKVKATFEKREVAFGEIIITKDEEDREKTIEVTVTNASEGSVAKPTGMVRFTFESPDATKVIYAKVDPATGKAKITNLQKALGEDSENGNVFFKTGAYEITPKYSGNVVFNEKEAEEGLHYLKDVDEGTWLSVKSKYKFGENILKSANLYKFERNSSGEVTRTDITKDVGLVRITGMGESKDFDMDMVGSFPSIPFEENFTDTADGITIEFFINKDDTEAAGKRTVHPEQVDATLYLKDKTTAKGTDAEVYTEDDIVLEGDEQASLSGPLDPEKLKVEYYDSAGSFMFDNDTAASKAKELEPGRYSARILPGDVGLDPEYAQYYNLTVKDAAYIILGSYYSISAEGDRLNGEDVGTVKLISPDEVYPVENVRYQGGSELTFKAEPSKGFKVKEWIIEDEDGEETVRPGSEKLIYRVSSASANKLAQIKIHAVFEANSNLLTVNTLGAGTVENDKNITNEGIVIQDTDVEFKATPESGWTFAEWRWNNLGKNTIVSEGVTEFGGKNTASFKMGDTPVVLTAIFKKDTSTIGLADNLKAYYIADGSDPTITEGKEIAIEDGRVPIGATVIVRTDPGFIKKAGAKWSVTGATVSEDKEIEAGNGYTFKLPNSKCSIKVSAAVERGMYGINVSGQHATVKVELDGVESTKLGSVKSGTGVSLTAYPDRGYKLSNWKINGNTLETEGDTYGTVLTKNMTAEAVCESIAPETLTLKTTGKGAGKYKITPENGEAVEETFDSAGKEVDCYLGEKVEITALPDKYSNITSITIDGKKNATTEAVYTIDKIKGDSSVTFGFEPNTYYSVTMDNQTDAVIMDSNKRVVEAGGKIQAAAGYSPFFYIKADADKDIFAIMAEDLLTLEDVTEDGATDGKKLWKCTMDDLSKNETISIVNRVVKYIRTPEELQSYLNDLEAVDAVDAKLMSDIDLADGEILTKTAAERTLQGTFNGNGHTLSGLSCGSLGTPAADPYKGLFSTIGQNGIVKDLTIDGFTIHSTQGEIAEPAKAGLIAGTNEGTIENCAVTDSVFYADGANNAGIAFENKGTIKNCLVADSKIDSSQSGADNCEAAIANINSGEGEIQTCYVYDLKNTNGALATEGLVVKENKSTDPDNAVCRDNYYDNGKDTIVTEPNGTNVWSILDNGTKPSVGSLAKLMNDNSGGQNWGITSNKDNAPIPIKSREDGKVVVPVKLTFGDQLTEYAYPKDIKIPDAGDGGILAWAAGDTIYSAGYQGVSVSGDTDFKPVISTEKYIEVKMTKGAQEQSMYFEDANRAFAEAQNIEGDPGTEKIITIAKTKDQTDETSNICRAAGQSGSANLKIDKDTKLILGNDTVFTLGEDTYIENEGTIEIGAKAMIDSYGTFQNNKIGKVDICAENESYGRFINRGKFKSEGEFTWQNRIECISHSWGAWTDAGDGVNETHQCEACLKKENREKLKLSMRPAAVKVICNEPYQLRAAVTPADRSEVVRWSSSDPNKVSVTDQGLIKGLQKGAKVTITAQTESGVNAFCNVTVLSPATSVDVAASKTLTEGDKYQLTAKISPVDTTDTIVWTTSKKSVATVSSTGKITAKKAGTVYITVRASSGKQDVCKVTVKKLSKPKLKELTVIKKSKATVKWSAVTKATGYKIYKSANGGKYKLAKTIKGNRHVKWTNKKLKSGKKYSYKVRAIRKIGSKTYYSNYSNAKSERIK